MRRPCKPERALRRAGAPATEVVPLILMQASDPASGYLSDVTFPDRFHRELSPSWLNYVSVLGGARPKALDRPFRYLDLGCGFAHSTVINAAAFAHAEFHACDFNPAHIEAAERRATRLGAGNVVFHEASFDALLDRDLPPFDFIVMHGVYSWVGSDVRHAIRQLLSHRLADGGLVYLSYNCQPGWSAEAPLRKLMVELAQAAQGGTEARTGSAVAAMRQLGTPSLRYFRDNPAAAGALAALADAPLDYVAHEFMNATWKVHYSVDVGDEMAEAGLAYVGSATLADNHPMLLIDRQAADAIAALPNARLRRLAEDFAVNRRFRRDVFLRGAGERVAPAEAIRHLDEIAIGCTTDVERIDTRMTIPRGAISFQPDFIADLRALMGRGAMRIGEIVARLGGERRNPREIRQNLLFLVASGALTPFAQPGGYTETGARRAASPAAAAALAAGAREAAPTFAPCEPLGGGIAVSADEAAKALRWIAGDAAPRPDRLARVGVLRGA
ncbi:class I SAM-dependent methyltransferase [Burkholderia thailandensis]|uniref:class I SAM-dependent methyltransferase n=2 Tax=Burkholderia thailandensis TaxID=57975 RepID=UPI00059BD51A|nr:class I SAM-dependent methyltransferase [Burkholderia thailandensis]AVR06336.1 methyltransferase domain-containing protein [Burkholderia thailandensis]AWY62416.1 methyltransferase [Burkholderia thailandensis]MCS6478867.1 class I SAM-dependent methyltransferase [Burkholderia thailandensis]MCS6494209.1 class I SAM-dependent methyltransferase [Burkholderia thailandensis]NBJ18413.1 methyltransferase [Burkholderia thailandensis]